MENRIMELRGKYANDIEASKILVQLAEEPGLHRCYSDFYAYEFFVARRPLAQTWLGILANSLSVQVLHLFRDSKLASETIHWF